MKNTGAKRKSEPLGTTLNKAVTEARRYRVLIFILCIALLYGFIVWRISVYSDAPTNQTEENARLAAQPHIDPTTVQKMQELQNNSVSVQSLFNQARQDPFQE